MVGDSYDNALAENVNGSYKNELIHTRRWNDVVEVEIFDGGSRLTGPSRIVAEGTTVL